MKNEIRMSKKIPIRPRGLSIASFLGAALVLSGCATGNAGHYGVELNGNSSAPFSSMTERSSRPYNVVGECLLTEFEKEFPASGITYRDLSASKQGRLWFVNGTDGILPSATNRLFDIEITDTGDESIIHAIAADHLFGTYMNDVRPAIEKCK